MNQIIDALDSLPLASLIVVLGAIGGVVALIQGTIDYQQFLTSLGVLSAGSAALGHVRTQSGKGLASFKETFRTRRP